MRGKRCASGTATPAPRATFDMAALYDIELDEGEVKRE
jgi:hypothetical protein